MSMTKTDQEKYWNWAAVFTSHTWHCPRGGMHTCYGSVTARKRGSQKDSPVGRHNFDDFIRWCNTVPIGYLLHVCTQLFFEWLFLTAE